MRSWFEEDAPFFAIQRGAVAESDESCGLSESDVFSLGLTSLPAARQPSFTEQRLQQQQAQPWSSAFACSAGLEGWPAGDVTRAAEPSLLEEALTSCGLQSLFPQLSENSSDAANTAVGRCSSLGPSGSVKPGDFCRLPSVSAPVRTHLLHAPRYCLRACLWLQKRS